MLAIEILSGKISQRQENDFVAFPPPSAAEIAALSVAVFCCEQARKFEYANRSVQAIAFVDQGLAALKSVSEWEGVGQ